MKDRMANAVVYVHNLASPSLRFLPFPLIDPLVSKPTETKAWPFLLTWLL